MGRLSIEIIPTNTIRMAMTMATIGRLMKKRDMKVSYRLIPWQCPCPLPARSSRGRGARLLSSRFFLPGSRHERLRIHHRAFFNFLYSLHNHLVAGFETFFDHPVRARPLPDFDRLKVGLVL